MWIIVAVHNLREPERAIGEPEGRGWKVSESWNHIEIQSRERKQVIKITADTHMQVHTKVQSDINTHTLHFYLENKTRQRKSKYYCPPSWIRPAFLLTPQDLALLPHKMLEAQMTHFCIWSSSARVALKSYRQNVDGFNHAVTQSALWWPKQFISLN